MSLGLFPERIFILGSERTHADLRRELSERMDERVGVGLDEETDTSLLKLKRGSVFQLSVRKTHNYHEPYTKNPQAYAWIDEFWHSE